MKKKNQREFAVKICKALDYKMDDVHRNCLGRFR